MNGREEMDAKHEKWIQTKLENCPDILRDYMMSITSCTSTSRRAYLGYLMQYVKYMAEQNVDLFDVKPMHIDRYKAYISVKPNGEKNGPSIINSKLSAVISFYNFLIKNRFVQMNPCSVEQKLKVPQKETVVYMTDEELQRLHKSISRGTHRHVYKYRNRDECIVQIGCATGLRINEILNINIDDLDFDNKMIHNVWVKGGYTRDVYIGDNTIEYIARWLRDRLEYFGDTETMALFLNKYGKRLNREAVYAMLKNETKDFGKKITPHKMRSTCGTKLYDKTGDIYLTAQQLGHKNIKNTMIYARASEQKLRDAAAILD